MHDAALAGIGVLVTRPRHQSDELVEAIEALGGTAFRLPCIDIVASDAAQTEAAVRALRVPDIVIFVSPNAVQHGLRFAQAARVAAIGPATAAAIEAAGKDVDIVPASGYDSEHLLDEPALREVNGKVIRIIRGAAGRELLADTLKRRGAIIEYLQVYDRIAPAYEHEDLAALEADFSSGRINVVVIMSVETLANFFEILPATCREALGHAWLVTPAKRVIKEAVDRLPGIPTILAQGPQTADIVNAIRTFSPNPPGQR